MNKLPDLQTADVLTAVMHLFRYAQVGRCVSSVTHDVNNLLGAVMAYAELVEMDPNLTPASRRMLGEVIEAARKCSRLVGNLSSVARKERADASLIEPDQLLTYVLDLRRYDMQTRQIILKEDCPTGLPSLVVDQPKLEQALIYLITNAMEALEDAADRRIEVRLCLEDGCVEIAIWNTGAVVPEGEREAIFEPFFTTKGPEHLGMGLYVTRLIATLHEGEISYDPDRGFILRLPLRNNLFKSLSQEK